MTTRCDVVVVGGGIAGLGAATVAARAGTQVVLLDRAPLGGRARTAEREGFHLNQGAHALFAGGAFRHLLGSLGIYPTGEPPAAREAHGWRDGHSHPLPSGLASLTRSRLFGARGKAALARLLGRLDRIDAGARSGLTVDEWMDAEYLPADAAEFMRMLVRVSSYSHAPDQLSAGAAIEQVRLGLGGVLYLDAGWQQIVDALAAAAGRAGASLRPGVGATAVRQDGPDWVVSTPDGDMAAPAVVLAAGGPATASRLLGEDRAGWAGCAGPATEASCLDLGVRQAPQPPILFDIDEPLYLSTHTPPADLAPDGLALVQLLRYLAPGERPSADATRDELRAHARNAGVQDADVVMERHLHRMTVAHGTPLAASGGLRGRPQVAVPGRSGLFVAGDWVGPTGMLADAAAASGSAAAAGAIERARSVTA